MANLSSEDLAEDGTVNKAPSVCVPAAARDGAQSHTPGGCGAAERSEQRCPQRPSCQGPPSCLPAPPASEHRGAPPVSSARRPAYHSRSLTLLARLALAVGRGSLDLPDLLQPLLQLCVLCAQAHETAGSPGPGAELSTTQRSARVSLAAQRAPGGATRSTQTCCGHLRCQPLRRGIASGRAGGACVAEEDLRTIAGHGAQGHAPLRRRGDSSDRVARHALARRWRSRSPLGGGGLLLHQRARVARRVQQLHSSWNNVVSLVKMFVFAICQRRVEEETWVGLRATTVALRQHWTRSTQPPCVETVAGCSSSKLRASSAAAPPTRLATSS